MKPDIMLFIIVMVLIGAGIFLSLYYFDKYPEIKKQFLDPIVRQMTGKPYDSEKQKPIKWWQALLFIVCTIIFVKIMMLTKS